MKTLTNKERDAMHADLCELSGKCRALAYVATRDTEKKFYAEMCVNYGALAAAIKEKQSFEAVA